MKETERDNQNLKEMYVINLDVSRIFWFSAIGLLIFVFLFLLGYWVGSDNTVVDSYIIDEPADSSSLLQNVDFSTESEYRDPAFPEEPDITDNPHEAVTSDISSAATTHEEVRTLPPPSVPSSVNQSSNVETLPVSNNSQSMRQDESSGSYFIQVGSHNSRQTAADLTNNLIDNGFEAYVVMATINGQTYYRVRIGPFTSENEAKSERQKLITEMSRISGITQSMVMKAN